jgi:Protein of unknown function (DUF3617)
MRYCRAISLAMVLCGLPAFAADMPSRKPGLWDVKMSVDGRNGLTVQQCVDEATDQMLLQSSGPISAAVCSKRDVQRTADSLIIDSSCKVDGKPATSHAVVTGSLDDSYTMTVTSTGEGLPAGLNMTLTGKWLGPCPSGQKPGDVTMPGGIRVNIPELQKHVPQPGDIPH